MRAIMTKNKTWTYASGEKPEPQAAESKLAWKEEDEKAKADLYLAVGDVELKQIRNCSTAREIWLKLEAIFESKGPAKKASLWKRLMNLRLGESDDIQRHVDEFFDTVDKLSELSVQVSTELQSIMLLHSLPDSFENFRCAIESRDELPSPEHLKIKILDESSTRKQRSQADDQAMFARRGKSTKGKTTNKMTHKSGDKAEVFRPSGTFKFRCHRCRQVGHKAIDCPEKNERNQKCSKDKEKAAVGEDISFLTSQNNNSCFAENIQGDNMWCLDSGCTSHLCRDERKFEQISSTENLKLNLANYESTAIKAKGTVKIAATNGDVIRIVHLENALHVPDLRNNLVSVAKITDAGNSVTFTKGEAIIKNDHGKKILVADRRGDLYFLRKPDEKLACIASTNARKSWMTIWHERFGHLNWRDLAEMSKKNIVQGLHLENDETMAVCEVCSEAKITALPFGKKSVRSSHVLDIIHADVCGPMRNESRGKAKYFLTLTDDYSRWTEVRFLRRKSEVLQAFKNFKILVEKQTGRKIKYLQSDNGKEFCNEEFDRFLRKEGIARKLTTPYTPQLNGVAERKNRTLMEMARCMMTQSRLPISFWAEAVATANFIRNRCISRTLGDKTPYELWHERRPNVKHMRTFGEIAYMLDKAPGKGKLEPRGLRCTFLGYDEPSRSYRVWVPSKQKVTVTRDIKFINTGEIVEDPKESISLLRDQNQGSIHKSEKRLPTYLEVHTDDNSEEEFQEEFEEDESQEYNAPTAEDTEERDALTETTKRGPGRPRKILTGKPGRPRRLFNLIQQEESSHISISDQEANLTSFSSEIPYQQALGGTDKEEWMKAITEEFECLIKNDTWKIVDRPKHQNVIGCRIVLRNKYDPKGLVERRKARLVAKGFTQRPGIDFHDTYAPVARMGSLRLLFALAVKHDLKVHQLDITTAYLHGTIEEETYMDLPESLTECLARIIDKGDDDVTRSRAKKMLKQIQSGEKVCRLQRALYGLKQAGRQWHKKLDDRLRKLNLIPTNADPCVYYLRRGGEPLLVLIYVDDILIFHRSEADFNTIYKGLSQEFEVRDIGTARYCLGIEFTRSKNQVTISQSGYIRELLSRFRMEDCNPVSTPVESGTKLEKDYEETKHPQGDWPYQELIGALNYLAVATRPDISHIVSCLSQFNTCYSGQHWKAAKRVLRYLKGTIDFGITYTKNTNALEGFVDADWAGCPVDRRSYTGFVFNLSGAAVSWESRKQRTIALSSTEAEYMALSEAAREALYLQGFLSELKLSDSKRIKLMNDNRGAQLLAHNHTFHARSKHIDIKHHFIREVLLRGQLEIKHIPSEEMPADFLTKGLTKDKHHKCLDLVGIKNLNNATLEGEC